MGEIFGYFNDVEGNLCLRINRLSRYGWVRDSFAVVSKLGDGGFWALAALVIYIVRGPAVLPLLGQTAITGLVGVGVYKLLKNRLVRERPYFNNGDIVLGAAPLDRYSFPSGHTLHAVSLTIMIGAIEPLLLIVAVPFAVLVAASRIILGLHYPSDVIVGAAIGGALASTSVQLF